MYERRLGKHERRQPRSVGSTQHSQRPAAASVRIRSSNPLKRINTTPAVPPNLHILPIPERALKQGWVFITQNRGLDDGTAALTPEAPARAAATERPEASGGAGSINSRRRSRAANQSAFRRALPDATRAEKSPDPVRGTSCNGCRKQESKLRPTHNDRPLPTSQLRLATMSTKRHGHGRNFVTLLRRQSVNPSMAIRTQDWSTMKLKLAVTTRPEK